MDLAELIKTRRTVHEYSNENVTEDTILRALELSLWAPNHRNTHPWQYFLVGPKCKTALVDLAIEIRRHGPKQCTEEILEMSRQKLMACPHIVALGMKKVEDDFQQREDYATIACSVQNISLLLHEQGIGSKWSTGQFTRHDKTYEILQVDPNEVEIVGVLLMGKALRPTQKIPVKPEFSAVLTRTP